jgi:outer membrane protein
MADNENRYMKNFIHALLFSFILIDIGNASSLLDVYQEAIINDPKIKEAFANKEAIIEAKPQARSFVLPQMTSTASYSDTDSNGRSTFQQKIVNPINGEELVITNNTEFLQESESLQWDVTLRQAIFDYGAWMNLRKANKTAAQAEIDYLAAEQDLIIRVANAYFNVLAAEDTLEAEQAARQAIEKQLDQAQKRFDVGLIAITDVQEAQAAYDQSIANEITSKRNLATAKESLRAITNSYPGQLDKPDNNLPLIMPNPQSESDWVETSLEQNLSYLSAQVGVEIAKSEIKIQRSGHLPTIGIQASKRDIDTDSFRSDSGNEYTPADNENINEGVGVQLNLPLYSGGQVTSRVRQAVARHRASKEKLERVARETTRIARDSYLGVISGIATVKALQQSVKSSATALQATEAGYEAGTRTTVDVLDARRRLYSSQKNLAISKYDYLKNILQLKQAAGTLTISDLEQINNWLK